MRRLEPYDSGDMKRLTAGREIGWQTMFRIARGITPDPHVSALEEIERILAEERA
jgi:hypothetical protein